MIQNLVDRNCKQIFLRPFVYLFFLILLTSIAFFYYINLTTETSLESLLFENDIDLIFYENFKEEFGDNVTLAVGFSAEDVFSQDSLEFISEQTEKIEKIDGVDEVISLSNIEHILGSDNDFLVQKLLEQFPSTAGEREKIRENALTSSLIRDSIVSRDSKTSLFLIIPSIDINTPDRDSKLVSKVKNIFNDAQKKWPQFSPHYAGGIQTRLSLTEHTNRDMLIFMPLTYLLLLILIFIIIRTPWLVFLAILNVSLCLIWTLGTLNVIGGSMSPMSSILPPLIMALAVSDSIHVFTEYLRQETVKKTVVDNINKTLKVLAVPCFLTSLTTAIGFLSLSISDVPPIRHFGIAAAIGMMIEFILTMTVIPLGIYFLRNKRSLKQKKSSGSVLFQSSLVTFASQLPNFRRIILTGSLILVIGSLYSSSLLQVETNLLEYFKKDSQIFKDAAFLDKNLGGTETLEISIRTDNPDQLLNVQTLRSIEKIEGFLQKQNIVSNTSSINDFFREMNKAFHNNDPRKLTLPASRELAAQYLLLYDGKDIENVLDSAHQWTHIAARINVHSSSKIQKLIEELNAFISNDVDQKNLEIRLTGQALISNKLIDYIVNSQVESLAMAFCLIFIVMLLIFKSIKLGLLSIIPNSLPILFNFAVMGITGIPLNSATAIIAAVAIGIAVDDTIHFIHAYQENKIKNKTTEESLKIAILQKAPPLISTSLILAGGFGILLFSSFVPTIQFGLLVSLIMIFAILSDLLILPCLLLKFDPTS